MFVPGTLCMIKPGNISQGVRVAGRNFTKAGEDCYVFPGVEEHVVVITTLHDMIKSKAIERGDANGRGLMSNDVLVVGQTGLFWMEDACLTLLVKM